MPGRKKSKSNNNGTTSSTSSNNSSSLQPSAEMLSFDKLIANFSQIVSPEAIAKRNDLREDRRRNNLIDLGTAIANAVSMNSMALSSSSSAAAVPAATAYSSYYFTCTNDFCKGKLPQKFGYCNHCGQKQA